MVMVSRLSMVSIVRDSRSRGCVFIFLEMVRSVF